MRFAGLLLCSVAAYGDITVAADGSGQYKTVQEAIAAAPSNSHARFVIHIKPGVYKEHVVVSHAKTFVSLIGDDPKTTILTNDWYASQVGGTFRTPSTSIEADDFIAENLTFENSAGAKGQAVALAVFGDRAVFRNCRFLGWQDTLLAQSGRQYFEKSYIEGAVDFIFGGSTAFFDQCHIHCRGNGYITAASTPKDQTYGYVFSRCKITAEPLVKTDLGRPWRADAAVAFLNSELPDAIRPAGWNNWSHPEREQTARYAEYRSSGAGANPAARVGWAKQLSDDEAAKLTVENVLSGIDGWNPKTGAVRLAMKSAGVEQAAVAPDKALLAVSSQGFSYSIDARNWTSVGSVPAFLIEPAIARGGDGVYHVVWRSGEKSLGFSSSKDLSHWSAVKRVVVMPQVEAIDVMSPSLFYDSREDRFIVSWASTITENFFQAYQEDVEDNPRLWYSTTRDFESFTPAKVLFEPGYTVRRGVIFADGNRFGILHEDSRQAIRALRVAFAPTPTGPWGASSDSISGNAAIVRVGTAWLISGEWITRDFWKFSTTGAPSHAASSTIDIPRAGLK